MPYLPAKTKTDIHRPANISLMNIDNNYIVNTHMITLDELMSLGNHISDLIDESNPNALAFPAPKMKKLNQ